MSTPIMDQSYQSYGGMDRPLFGETNKKVQSFQAFFFPDCFVSAVLLLITVYFYVCYFTYLLFCIYLSYIIMSFYYINLFLGNLHTLCTWCLYNDSSYSELFFSISLLFLFIFSAVLGDVI